MIIKEADLIGKRKKFLILVISFFVDIVIVAAITSVIVTSFNSNDYENKRITLAEVLFFGLGTMSIVDIIGIAIKKKSFAFYLVQKTMKRFNSKASIPVSLNSTQKSFCEMIYGIENKKSYIYVFGRKGKGKTTAVLSLLDGFSKNIDNLNEIPWITNFTYIDCTSNKDDILNYFDMNHSIYSRIQTFTNALTVIDNIEQLGEAFFKENIGLFSSYKSLFIIIEDVSNDSPMCELDNYKRSLLVSDFKSSVIGLVPISTLGRQLYELDSTSKKVFFSLYFLTAFSEFSDIKDINKIIRINMFSLYLALRKIKKLNIFTPFPFNAQYYYCSNRIYLKSLSDIFQQYDEYKFVLAAFVKSNATNAECRWLCLLYSDEKIIIKLSPEERIRLFHKALYNGQYLELYNELNCCLKKTPNKEKVFLYEKGFLSFYVGNHGDAAKVFLKLIDTYPSMEKRKEMMLHIIECSHGDPDELNMNLIYRFIKELQSFEDFYGVCSLYWLKHIETEKGIFEYSSFPIIRKKLKMYSKYANHPLYKSIIHRCFLDEIRCCHILSIQPSDEFLLEYRGFLNTCSNDRAVYYSNLYIEANTIHYVLLMTMIIKDEFSEEEIIVQAQNAESFYMQALSSSYSDEKSKRATRIKLFDLRMIYSDFDYPKTVHQINLFKIHSQINKVQVHEAYCETLLIKAKILNPANLSPNIGLFFPEETKREIHNHFNAGYEIYQKYGNKYGLLRLELLEFLFRYLTLEYSDEVFTSKVRVFKNKYIDYPKELCILDSLLNRLTEGLCSPAYIFSIIRAYPMILQ